MKTQVKQKLMKLRLSFRIMRGDDDEDEVDADADAIDEVCVEKNQGTRRENEILSVEGKSTHGFR